jgi:site-specific recombinase XerD
METESRTIAFGQLGIQEIKRENQKTIDGYITARKMETNISNYTQLNTCKTLKYFSRHINKNFQDVTRQDIASFLNSLRKNETHDRSEP